MAEETPPPSGNRPFRQWRLLAIVFALAITGLAAWYFLFLRPAYAVLFDDLRPAEAAAVVAALEEQGVRYKLGDGGAQVSVPANQIDALRLHFAASDLQIGGLAGFEIFDESDMGLTDFAEKIRYQRAIQGELARTIMRMEGVVEARVHISLPERTLFRNERRSAEAAVTIVTRAPEDETPARIEGVQRLVAAAVPDLSPIDVVVLNARGEIISSRVEISSTSGDAGEMDWLSAEFVTEVLRRALPNRRFHAEIAYEPERLAGDPSDVSTDAATRRLIKVSTESSLNDAERDRVRTELYGAGVIDGSASQAVLFQVEPIAPAPTLPLANAPVSPEAAGTLVPSANITNFPFVSALASAGLLLLAGAALFWLRPRPRLSASERETFAERLRADLRRQAAGDVDG